MKYLLVLCSALLFQEEVQLFPWPKASEQVRDDLVWQYYGAMGIEMFTQESQSEFLNKFIATDFDKDGDWDLIYHGWNEGAWKELVFFAVEDFKIQQRLILFGDVNLIHQRDSNHYIFSMFKGAEYDDEDENSIYEVSIYKDSIKTELNDMLLSFWSCPNPEQYLSESVRFELKKSCSVFTGPSTKFYSDFKYPLNAQGDALGFTLDSLGSRWYYVEMASNDSVFWANQSDTTYFRYGGYIYEGCLPDSVVLAK